MMVQWDTGNNKWWSGRNLFGFGTYGRKVGDYGGRGGDKYCRFTSVLFLRPLGLLWRNFLEEIEMKWKYEEEGKATKISRRIIVALSSIN